MHWPHQQGPALLTYACFVLLTYKSCNVLVLEGVQILELTTVIALSKRLFPAAQSATVKSPCADSLFVLTGMLGGFHQHRDPARIRRVQLSGLQKREGVCHQEADCVPVSSCAGSAP